MDWQFQSPTWFKKFQACEAEALAELKGDWQPTSNPTALLVGNYVHSYFESAESHQTFLDENAASIFKKNGEPRSEFVQADAMIATLDRDDYFHQLYQGDKEVMITGEIDGVTWKGKLDDFPPSHKYFADIKTTQDLHKRFWLSDDRRWGSFIEAYNYPLQMAVYQELIRQQYGVKPPPIIIGVTKQDPPDHDFISIPQELLDYAMQEVLDNQACVEAVKTGQEEPTRCEHCEYCRATKVVTKLTSVYDLVD